MATRRAKSVLMVIFMCFGCSQSGTEPREQAKAIAADSQDRDRKQNKSDSTTKLDETGSKQNGDLYEEEASFDDAFEQDITTDSIRVATPVEQTAFGDKEAPAVKPSSESISIQTAFITYNPYTQDTIIALKSNHGRAEYETLAAFGFLREEIAGSHGLQVCKAKNDQRHYLATADHGCGADEDLGILGFAYSQESAGVREIFHCRSSAESNHLYLSFEPGTCTEAGDTVVTGLGFVYDFSLSP